jgi:hypothetical protein
VKLAEALQLRAEKNRTFEQLRSRIQANARYQEGETPPEEARALVEAAVSILDELETLIRRINQTNSGAHLPDGRTITDGLAERDVLRLRYSLFSSSADAASGAGPRGGMFRTARSELKIVTPLDVRALRQRASDVARRVREVDAQIQQLNWTIELLED